MADAHHPRLSLFAYAWALPTTAFGLLVVAATWSWRMSCVNGVLEVEAPRAIWLLGSILRMIAKITGSEAISPGAFVLGHVIFAVDGENASYWRPHERVHVRQNERWGMAWLPMYVLASAWAMARGKDPYYDNFFEVEAYAVWPGRGHVG